MRLILSVLALLIAVLCVLLLARSQLQTIRPAPAPPAAAAMPAAGPGTAATTGAAVEALPANPATLPRQVQQDVTRALEQGMAARASAVLP